MEAGGKDRPPMLAPSNYVQWKSRIKRYIDTKPNHELIHYCLKNPPCKFTWADKQVPIFEGSHVTTTETYMETYKNVSQDIRNQLNAEAEAVQIILTGIDNDIYSTVDACLNAQADWRDDTDDELEDQELETHYMYMAQIQEVSPDAANSGPIFDSEPVEQIDQNDDDDDLANERELLASLIEKLKCEIDDSKNRHKFLETSNKVLVEKLKEANNKLSETNKLMYNDFKKSQAEIQRRNDVQYASKVEIDCAKARRFNIIQNGISKVIQ
nr:hypothetical protein [Tanacetum cinerariifolium]